MNNEPNLSTSPRQKRRFENSMDYGRYLEKNWDSNLITYSETSVEEYYDQLDFLRRYHYAEKDRWLQIAEAFRVKSYEDACFEVMENLRTAYTDSDRLYYASLTPPQFGETIYWKAVSLYLRKRPPLGCTKCGGHETQVHHQFYYVSKGYLVEYPNFEGTVHGQEHLLMEATLHPNVPLPYPEIRDLLAVLCVRHHREIEGLPQWW